MKDQPYKILIVDDDKNNVLLIQEFLEMYGILSDYVNNGTEALRIVKVNTYDLILLDIMMPGINGIEVCNKLKENPLTKLIPIIFITAIKDISTISMAFELGAVDYITKPFNLDETYARIKTHLALKSANERLRKELRKRKSIQKKLEESENKYRTLFENSGMPVGIAQFDGQIVDVNQAMCDFFDYSKSELLKLSVKSLYLDEKHRDKIIAEINETGHIKNREIDLKNKNGERIIGLLTANTISLNGKKVLLTAFSDVTKQKEIDKNILKAIIETEEKEKSYFAQELHDGLGPILSTIKLYLQSVLEAKTPQKVDYFLENANHSLEEAIIAITEISNKLSPHVLKNFGLVSGINSFIEKIRITSGISILFEANFSKRFNNLIETTIYRIVNELINNTLKYAKARNIYIKLVLADKQLILEYKDNGIGFTVSDALTFNSKGFGLFNLQNRIRTLKGDIQVESTKGSGAKFIINVPVGER